MVSESDIHATFSRSLRYYLELNKMKQNELAKRMGVSTSTVNDWVSGEKIPRMSRIDMLCLIFGCTRSALLEKDNKAEENKMLKSFYSLNSEGQQKVIDYMTDLINSGRYKKHDFDEVVEA